MRKAVALLWLPIALAGCVALPQGIEPVGDFELGRYLGKWYEIARLDHSFERDLSRVTAEYSLMDDGGVRVLNRGYSESDGAWKETEGRAYFVEGEDQGFLKVSFFGPFFGSYIIVELDREDYGFALVCGPDRSYLWILAREPQLDEETLASLVGRAAELGFDTGALIYVDHSELPDGTVNGG